MNKVVLKSHPMAKEVKKTSNFRNFRDNFKKHWKRNVLIIVLLLVAFFIYKSVTAEPEGITSTKVARSTLISDFNANGRVKAGKSADLKFYSPGKLSWIGVKKGDKVKVRQTVASLNKTSLYSQHQQALNSLRNFQAMAEKTLDDVQGHEKDESFTQRMLRTTAEVNRDNSYLATVVSADNLNNANLISPIAGTVTTTNDLIAGVNLSGADIESKFIRIVDFDSLFFEADVDEIDYSKVKPGQEVIINVDAYPQNSCSGKVIYISRDGQKTSGGVVTYPTEIEIGKCDLEYAVGLNGQAHFVLGKEENVLVIPKKYIVTKDGKSYVWKQTGDTTKQRKLTEIVPGNSGSTETEVRSGIEEEDTIVFVP